MRNGDIDFTNYNRQLVVYFKIYDDFEPILKEGQRVNRDNFANTSCTDKYQKQILFLILIVTKMLFTKLLKQFLVKMNFVERL